MQPEAIHCRLPAAILEKLDERVALLRQKGVDPLLATRSAVLRALLAQQLGVQSAELVEFEILCSSQRIIYGFRSQLRHRLKTAISSALETALAYEPEPSTSLSGEPAGG